jgi:hypothetical protein
VPYDGYEESYTFEIITKNKKIMKQIIAKLDKYMSVPVPASNNRKKNIQLFS